MIIKSQSLTNILREIFTEAILKLGQEITTPSKNKNLLKELQDKLNQKEIVVKIPAKKHGDFTTTIALELAKILRNNPLLIAEQLKEKIITLTTENRIFEQINCLAPGYLNLTLTNSFRQSLITNIFKNIKNYAKAEPHLNVKQTKILLEYVSANPTGPLHIGHGRWAVIGSILANILKHYGYNTKSEFYINDAGNQINNFIASVEAIRNNQPIPKEGYHGEYLEQFKNNNQDPVETILAEQKKMSS